MIPGTVSKILWHFTGGPLWNENLNKQEEKPKPMSLGFDIVLNILKTKQLRISNYSELIRVIVPEVTFWNNKERKIDKKYNVEETIESSPVCCLADIPIQHLNFHSKRYGKFAIGFHRNSAVKNNFNPVFYSLHNSPIMSSIYSGFSIINSSTETYHIKYKLRDIENLSEDIQSEVENIDNEINATKESLSNFIAFVKTFNQEEFNSIYCEREWRSLVPFNFGFDDIAMIVLPREGGFFDKLIELDIIPRNISIIAWEDLIEH